MEERERATITVTHTHTLSEGGRTVYSAIKVRREMGKGERREERVRRRKEKGGVG